MSFFQCCFSLIVVSLRFSYPVLAQEQNVQFNQVANLNGDMQLNRLIYPDGTKIETFSQTQRQILVNQNTAPLSANHVVGSTGQPFVQLSQSSLTITTNTANDLVGAQIEMPIQQATLDQNGVSADNTFVAMLSEDRQTWMVMEGIKSVNTTDSTVRMLKLNALDGEYIAIGRKTVETSNVLSPFGQDQQRSVSINGSGIQEVEFTDGFRMTVRASQPMTVNVDVVNGVSTSMLVNNAMPVNNYRYLVRTNLGAVQPALNQMMAVVQLPLNAVRLMSNAQRMGAGPNDMISLSIQQRGVLQNPGGATASLSPQKRQEDEESSTSQSAAPINSSNSTVKSTTSKPAAKSTSIKTTSTASKTTAQSAASAASASSEPTAESNASEADAQGEAAESVAQSTTSESAAAAQSTSSDSASAQSTTSESTAAQSAAAESTSAGNSTANAADASSTSAASSASSAASSASSSSSTSSASTTTDASASPQPQSQANQGSVNNQNSNQNPAATTLLLAPTFTPITSRTILDPQSGRIAATVPQLDGEFILTMAVGATQGQAAQGTAQQPATAANTTAEAPGAAPALPLPPAKRQAAAPQYGLVMSMADLTAMAARQKNGGILPASQMMTEFYNQQKSAPAVKR